MVGNISSFSHFFNKVLWVLSERVFGFWTDDCTKKQSDRTVDSTLAYELIIMWWCLTVTVLSTKNCLATLVNKITYSDFWKVCELCIWTIGTTESLKLFSLSLFFAPSGHKSKWTWQPVLEKTGNAKSWLVPTHSLPWQESFWIIELQWSSAEPSVLCHVAALIRNSTAACCMLTDSQGGVCLAEP